MALAAWAEGFAFSFGLFFGSFFSTEKKERFCRSFSKRKGGVSIIKIAKAARCLGGFCAEGLFFAFLVIAFLFASFSFLEKGENADQL